MACTTSEDSIKIWPITVAVSFFFVQNKVSERYDFDLNEAIVVYDFIT